MPELGPTIKARRVALGMEQTDLSEAIGSTPTQVGRWENGRQEPTASYVRKIARALGVSADELLGLAPMDLDLSGAWFAAWDTSRGGVPVVDSHTLTATHRGSAFDFRATGSYLFTGSLHLIDGSMAGHYVSSERDKLYRGALHLDLSPDTRAAAGHWAGRSTDGSGVGWGVLARDEGRAARLMQILKNHEGPLTEWPQEDEA